MAEPWVSLFRRIGSSWPAARKPKHWRNTRNGSVVAPVSISGPPHAQAQSTRWSFPILFPGFQLLLPEKERGALGEVERLLEVGLMRKDRAVPWRSGWGLDAAGRIGRGLEQESVSRAWRVDGAELVSSGAGLQDCAPRCLRCAVNKRGPGGSRRRAATARRPGAAGTPAARPSVGPGDAPVGVPGRAWLASFSEFICPQCSQRA